jgi:putative flippase GtrA
VSTQAGKSGSWFGSARSALLGRRSLGRYALLGLIGLVIDLGVFGILIAITVIPAIATLASSFLGMVTNYALNARFNFYQGFTGRQLGKFVLVGGVGLGFAVLLLELFLWLGVSVWFAKILSLAIVVIGQYSANKLWTFR